MAGIVTIKDIELGAPQLINVSATAAQLLPSRLGKTFRKSFYLVPLTAGVLVTIVPSEGSVVANTGYVLSQYQPFLDVRSEGYKPYQGEWKVVASGNGQVALVEQVDPQ